MAIIVDKAQKRKDIALACKQLIFQNGIRNLTVSQITQQANIGKGTLYSYFKNKEEIVIEIINLLFTEHKIGLIKNLKNLDSTLDKLKLFSTFFYDDEYIEIRELYKEFVSILVIKQQDEFADFKTKTFNTYYGLFKEVVVDAVNQGELKPEAVALSHGIFLTPEGMFISKLMRNDMQNLKAEINKYLEMIFYVLKSNNNTTSKIEK